MMKQSNYRLIVVFVTFLISILVNAKPAWKTPSLMPTIIKTNRPVIISQYPSALPTPMLTSYPTGKAQFGVWTELSANSTFPGRHWHSSVYDRPSHTIYTIGGTTSLFLNLNVSFQDIWAFKTLTSKYN